MGNFLETPNFMSPKGEGDKIYELRWHYDNCLGKTPFQTVSKFYNKDGSPLQDLFADEGLDWPDTEEKVDEFFNELNVDQATVLLDALNNLSKNN